MVADSTPGFLPYPDGFGALHPRSGSALAVYVFSQVAPRDATASANAPPGFDPPSGPVGWVAGGRLGGVWPGGGGSDFSRAGAALRGRVG
jgi:hypothetical protein